MDLRDEKSCRMLYERVRAEEIDILINNAGFGSAAPSMRRAWIGSWR